MLLASSLHQHETYARAVRRVGGCPRWYDTESGPILVIERRMLGLSFLWAAGLPHGVSLPPSNVVIFNTRHSGPHPDWALRVAKGGETALWDIRPDVTHLRAGLFPKWRNRLARAERSGIGVDVKELPPDPVHWLLAQAQEHGKACGYRSWPPALTAAYAAEPKATLLVQTADESAAMLFLRHGRGATYHLGWRSRHAAVGAHNLLLWQAIMALKNDGIEKIDLGVLPNSNRGLCHFKFGTGAEVQRAGDTFVKLGFSHEKSRQSGGFFRKVSGFIQPP